MVSWEIWFAVVPGLILFLYGIENFSREIQRVAGERFRSLLIRLTKNPLSGATLGAIVTAIIQSSTATTVIVVGLVNAGTIPFAQSLGVMFGANIGTTITAQLIAFKLTGFAPFFILAGFLLSIFGGRYKFLGKPLFYFGLVFFSLLLISEAISPIKDDPEVIGFFSQLSNVYLAILAGILFTVLIQSSSVTTGIVVLLAGSGLIGLAEGIPIILGSNIGTTMTSLFAAARMDLFARRASVAHFLFNVGGVMIFLPFIGIFASLVADLGGSPAQQVANAHLIFNLIAAAIFLVAIEPFRKAVERLVPGEEREVLFYAKYIPEDLPEDNPTAFELIEEELKNSMGITLKLFGDSMGYMRTNGSSLFQKISKLESLNDFLDDKIGDALLKMSKRQLSREEAERTVLLVRMSNEIERLGDLGEDLGYLANGMAESGISFSSISGEELAKVYDSFALNASILSESLPEMDAKTKALMRKNDNSFRALVNQGYKNHLERLYRQKAYAGSSYVEAISIIDDANANVREIRKLSELYSKI